MSLRAAKSANRGTCQVARPNWRLRRIAWPGVGRRTMMAADPPRRRPVNRSCRYLVACAMRRCPADAVEAAQDIHSKTCLGTWHLRTTRRCEQAAGRYAANRATNRQRNRRVGFKTSVGREAAYSTDPSRTPTNWRSTAPLRRTGDPPIVAGLAVGEEYKNSHWRDSFTGSHRRYRDAGQARHGRHRSMRHGFMGNHWSDPAAGRRRTPGPAAVRVELDQIRNDEGHRAAAGEPAAAPAAEARWPIRAL